MHKLMKCFKSGLRRESSHRITWMDSCYHMKQSSHQIMYGGSDDVHEYLCFLGERIQPVADIQTSKTHKDVGKVRKDFGWSIPHPQHSNKKIMHLFYALCASISIFLIVHVLVSLYSNEHARGKTLNCSATIKINNRYGIIFLQAQLEQTIQDESK